MKLDAKCHKLHQESMRMARAHRKIEAQWIDQVIKITTSDLLRQLGVGIFNYAIKYLKFHTSTAYGFKAVAERCQKIPVLHQAIQKGRINVRTASRMLSNINSENAEELIAFAEKNTCEALERKLAGLNPQKSRKTTVTFVDENTVKVSYYMNIGEYENYKRIKSLEAQKGNHEDVHPPAHDAYLDQNDPVRKAERSEKRKQKKGPKDSARAESEREEFGRVAFTAAELDAVNLRDRGRCAHIHEDGTRCDEDRYLHIHHVKHVKDGGTNALENLVTLCSRHHAMRHQNEYRPKRREHHTLPAL